MIEIIFHCRSINGENKHYGTPTNPHAADHVPGGSSSGSAVAVGAKLVNFSLGKGLKSFIPKVSDCLAMAMFVNYPCEHELNVRNNRRDRHLWECKSSCIILWNLGFPTFA